VIREGAASVVEIAHGPTPPATRQPQRTWPEWPALLRTYAAHQEGGERAYELEPLAFLGDGAGHVRAIRARRVSFPGYDGVGRRPAAVPGEELELACSRVLVAVGFLGVEDDPVYDGVALTGRSTVGVDERGETSLPGVFAAGDCVRGADLVVTAIAEGRAIATAVERFLAAGVPADE
jgi:glutamate synthase (NADPH/NADH) small chain